MSQAVLSADGAAALLRWLARRLKATASVVTPAGLPARSFPADPPEDILSAARSGIARIASGTLNAAAFAGPGWWARAVGPVTAAGEVLMAVGRSAPSDGDAEVLSRAGALLALRYAADDRDRAVERTRVAVFRLLMTGQEALARSVAEGIGPPLPDEARVYVVEDTADPDAAAAAAASLCRGGWVVRCPVYRQQGHVIILMPADDGGTVIRAVTRARPSATVGASGVVSLAAAADGYDQACHALWMARHRPQRTAVYAAAGDLAGVLGPAAGKWARARLAPLSGHVRARQQDPGADELLSTLRAWLGFRRAAHRTLHIHPNTLAARISRIGGILEEDLQAVNVQAELHLALQLVSQPDNGDDSLPAGSAEEILRTAEARSWASMFLAPLPAGLRGTLRAWYRADCRGPAAAAELGISQRRLKRLIDEAGQHLGHSLTGDPGASLDLCLALRAAPQSGSPGAAGGPGDPAGSRPENDSLPEPGEAQ